MGAFKWLIVFILMFIIIWFAIENADQKVNVKLFKTEFLEVPLVLVMFESFIAGVLIWFLVSLFQNMKLRVQVKTLNNNSDQLRKELAELKGTEAKEIPDSFQNNKSIEEGEN